MTYRAYFNSAVRILNEVISSLVTADPEKRSVARPIIGSLEKVMAIMACGFTKKARIWVMSVSPIMVTDIAWVALGASMTIRSQISLPWAAESRVAFEIA